MRRVGKVTEEFFSQIIDFHLIAFDVLSLKNLRSEEGLIIFLITIIVGMNLTSKLLFIFLVFYLLDFATGFLASKVELERRKQVGDDSDSPYLIQSSKLIRGGVKFSAYCIIFILSYIVELLLVSPVVSFHPTIIDITPTQVGLLVGIASEVVSNFENTKRAGFDIIGSITQFPKHVWKIINAVRGNNE